MLAHAEFRFDRSFLDLDFHGMRWTTSSFGNRSGAEAHFGMIMDDYDTRATKKILLLSIESWLFNRDLYKGLS